MASTKGIPAILLTYESMNNFHKNMSQIVPILSIFYTGSILFGVSLSFERYMFFNYLHLHTTIFTCWKIIFWIITINMFSIIVNIPIFLDWARWFYMIRFIIAMLFYIGFESMTYKEVIYDLITLAVNLRIFPWAVYHIITSRIPNYELRTNQIILSWQKRKQIGNNVI